MESWIEFGRGPLFRLAFSLMVLGLLRAVLLSFVQIAEALGKSRDKCVQWKEILRQTACWLLPAGRLWRKRPIYSTLSFAFHIGLLAVPLFLAAHVLLWKKTLGFAWPALPREVADWLTLLAIVTGLALFISRVANPRTRALSRGQDYFWPLLLVVPFATGYVCSHSALRPGLYQNLMLIHVYAADLILVLVPFTKIAHCVLAPMSQLVSAIAWKFVPGAGDRVAATLGYADKPTWVDKARLHAAAQPEVSAK